MNKLLGILFIGIFFCCAGSSHAGEIIQDELVNTTLLDKKIEKPEPFENYNFENTDVVEIKLAIVDAIMRSRIGKAFDKVHLPITPQTA